MKKESAEFWSQRYKAMGHTGWSDPRIYSYDQVERLGSIERIIETLPIESRQVLDFGCGTGDFSRMLLNKGFRVYGYDPYVEPKISNPDFSYISEHGQIDGLIKEPVGLILSMTVLDHILDESRFYDELVYLRTKIAKTGFFLCLEYALEESVIQKSDYQAFRTMSQWKTSLTKAGWQICNAIPMAHPIFAPSSGFKNFQKDIFVVLTKTFAHRRYFRKILLPVLKYKARSVFRRYGVEKVGTSSLKLMICRPDGI